MKGRPQAAGRSGETVRAAGARSFDMRWASPFAAVYLVTPIYHLFQAGRPAIVSAAGLAGIVLFGALCIRVLWVSIPRPHTNPAPAALTAMVVVGVALLPVFGSSETWLVTASYYLAAVLVLSQPPVWWIPCLVALVGADVAVAALVLGLDGGDVSVIALQIAVFSVGMSGFYGFVRVTAALRVARAELARAAVGQERLRIARDLHDLLGQQLTVVALKTELAGRLMDHDPGQARQELASARDTARSALDDVRAAVSGYRRTSFTSEVATARTVLRSAGVGVVVPDGNPGLPDELDEVAAQVVREGVTNVLRHAGARRCVIEVTTGATVTVSVADDGPRVTGVRPLHDRDPGGRGPLAGRPQELESRGGRSPETGQEEAAPPSEPTFGYGLTGLSERVQALGGRLGATVTDGWFELRAELPATAAGPGGA